MSPEVAWEAARAAADLTPAGLEALEAVEPDDVDLAIWALETEEA